MEKKLSSLQERVLRGKYQKENAYDELEAQGSGDEIYDRIKALVGPDSGAIKDVSFSLTPEERTAMYFSIVELIRSGEEPEVIAKHILNVLQDKLNELKNEAQNVEGPKSPVFRRAE